MFDQHPDRTRYPAHVVFSAVRWALWLVAVGWLFARGAPTQSQAQVIALAGVLNIALALIGRSYVALMQRTPALLAIDVIAGALALVASGGWNSSLPLICYAGLVLPAVLYGWRGGVMAGLSFVSASLALLWITGAPPDTLLRDGGWQSVVQLAMRMLAPPVAGALLAAALWLARRRRVRPSSAPAIAPLRSEADGPLPSVRPLSPTIIRDRRPDLFEESSSRIQTVRTSTEQAVEEVRRLLFAPFPQTNPNLETALDMLAARFTTHTSIATSVTHYGTLTAIGDMYCALLIRLTREALLNVRQHTSADSVAITTHYEPGMVTLIVRDNGAGLIDGSHERPGLHTLRAMTYRVTEFGGHIEIFEAESGGVTMRARLPLES